MLDKVLNTHSGNRTEEQQHDTTEYGRRNALQEGTEFSDDGEYHSRTCRQHLVSFGYLRQYEIATVHRSGIGRQLVEKAKQVARSEGYEFMQVKTVKMGVYEDYDRTNLFYISCGFRELEVFPLYWDEANPCQAFSPS